MIAVTRTEGPCGDPVVLYDDFTALLFDIQKCEAPWLWYACPEKFISININHSIPVDWQKYFTVVGIKDLENTKSIMTNAIQNLTESKTMLNLQKEESK